MIRRCYPQTIFLTNQKQFIKEKKMKIKKSGILKRVLFALFLFLAIGTVLSAAAWAPYTYYTVGTVVTYNGVNYTCRQAHTSLPGWEPPNVPALWLAGGTAATSTPAAATPTPTRPAGTTATPTPTTGATPTTPSGSGFPAKVFAPYVDVTLWPTFSITNCNASTGQKYFTLAFIINNASNQPSWGGAYTMAENWMLSDITTLRSKGGDVIVSFGGANGWPIDYVITDLTTLVNAYQSIINQYKLKWIDLDIEGYWIAETASVDRRNQAMAKLQAANPGLRITYCLPVLPTGLTQDGLNVISNARSKGVNIYCVNVMAMDYGSYAAPNGNGGMGGYANSAASSTRSQTGLNIGITPMIGYNDVAGEIFSLSDASTVLSFANANSYISMLAMWSATRDNGGCAGVVSPSCSGLSQSSFAFINVFKSFTR
jgi:hypothetical protein